MASYDHTKFYWYMLTEDFFRKDHIEWLRDRKNGNDYTLLYLALCSRSIKTDGVLIRDIGDIKEPCTNEFLAKDLKFRLKIVNEAMDLFKQMGLIKIHDDGAIILTNLENMVGERSKGAFKKQVQLRLKGGNLEENIPPDIDGEKDSDSEKGIDPYLYYQNRREREDFVKENDLPF